MFQNFLVSIQAVIPLFLMMFLGFIVQKKKWLTDLEVNRFNGMVFKVLFPFMVFNSIYQTDLTVSFHPALIVYAILAITAVYLISLFLIPRIEPDDKSRGAMIQSIYRSNFVLLGLPLVGNLFPGVDLGMTALLIALIVPYYNLLAVITLEVFRGGKPSLKTILYGIVTNPLIIGSMAGIVASTVSFPAVINSTISQLAGAATPIALILLGASFHTDSNPHKRRNLILCIVCRLLVVPGLCLTVAALLGFRDLAFVTLIAMFGTPASVSSFTMAQQMNSDDELAGSCVIFTSLFSCFTLFAWIFLFKQLGIC
ncbi:MAG: AEC family transporter [Evtepia sp.]